MATKAALNTTAERTKDEIKINENTNLARKMFSMEKTHRLKTK